MRAHLIHGFNVSDGGNASIGRLLPFFDRDDDTAIMHAYGWVGLIRLRWRNAKVTRRILPEVQDGDVLIGHSNGCLICWELVEAGARPGLVICVQPAMRRDTDWPPHVPVLCLYNKRDWAVTLGRVWGRLVSVANPFKGMHGWGSAGRHGFTAGQSHVENWDTDIEPTPARGHSAVFHPPCLRWWAPRLRWWARHTLREQGIE